MQQEVSCNQLWFFGLISTLVGHQLVIAVSDRVVTIITLGRIQHCLFIKYQLSVSSISEPMLSEAVFDELIQPLSKGSMVCKNIVDAEPKTTEFLRLREDFLSK